MRRSVGADSHARAAVDWTVDGGGPRPSFFLAGAGTVAGRLHLWPATGEHIAVRRPCNAIQVKNQ